MFSAALFEEGKYINYDTSTLWITKWLLKTQYIFYVLIWVASHALLTEGGVGQDVGKILHGMILEAVMLYMCMFTYLSKI